MFGSSHLYLVITARFDGNRQHRRLPWDIPCFRPLPRGDVYVEYFSSVYYIERATPGFVRTGNYDNLAGVLLAVTGCEAMFAK